MDSSKIKGAITRSRALRSAAIILFLVTIFPILALMVGQYYLPSREYMQMTATIAPAIGYTMGIALLLLMLKEYRKEPHATWKGAIGVVASPFAGYILGINTVMAVPMLMALLAGQQIEHRFVVKNTDDGSGRCPRSVTFQELPLMFGWVCEVSDDFREQLVAGTHVAVKGRGNRFGVFADEMRIVAKTD